MPWLTDQNGFTYWEPDEGYGGGAPIISPITEPAPTPPPEAQEPAYTPPATDPWKPDFTTPEPWAGMPPDYEGIGTYTPDPESGSVVPPWEQPASGGGTAPPPGIPKYGTPEYQERAAEISTKVLAPYATPDGTYDIKKIAEDGKVEFLRGIGADETVIRKAQQYAQDLAAYQRASKSEIAAYEQEMAAFEKENVKLADGRWIPREIFDSMSADDRKLAVEQGYEAVYARYQSELADFEKNNVKLPPDLYHPDGTWITRESFDKLPRDAQKLALERGLTAMLNSYEATNSPDAAKLLPADVYAIYRDQSPADKFAILKAYGAVPEDASYVKADASGNPMFRRGGDATTAIINSKNMPLLIGDVLVPGFATVRHWKDMSAGERALSIGLDALILIPIAGAAGKAARGSYAVTRAGRLADVAKGMGREAVMQLRAPVDTVLHPIQTVKGTAGGVRNLVENVVSPRKLSEVVITTTHNTVRIPISKVKSAEDAAAAGDTLMNLAKRTGETPVIEMNGVRYELARSPLMKELGGGLAHGTPMGQNFADLQTKVAKEFKVEGNLYLSHEPATRFVPVTAGGQTGPRPTIVILSPTLAKDAQSSQKLYAGTKELESILPDGYVVPKYTQRLYTRIGPNHTRVDILLVDNKLSAAQIAKLKGLAAVEDLKAIVTPGVLISGKPKGAGRLLDQGLTEAEVARLAEELRASGNTAAARSLLKASGILGTTTPRSGGDLVATASMRSGGRFSEDIISIRATGTPREPVGRAGYSADPIAFRTTPRAEFTGRVDTRVPRPEELTARRPRIGEETRRPPETTEDRRPPTAPEDRRTPIPPDDRRPPTTPEDRRAPLPPDYRRPPLPPDDRRPPSPPEDRRPPRPPEENRPPLPPDERKPPRPPDDGRPPPPPPPPRRRKGPVSEDETRRRIADADTKAAWVQGELNGKAVVHVVFGKAGVYEHAVVMGAIPEGVVMAEGKGQAYRTMRLTEGIPPSRPVTFEGGAVDPTVYPTTDDRGVEIRFARDPNNKPPKKDKEKPMFRINRKGGRSSRGFDLGADIVRDRRGRHLRL